MTRSRFHWTLETPTSPAPSNCSADFGSRVLTGEWTSASGLGCGESLNPGELAGCASGPSLYLAEGGRSVSVERD
jgi:hypothetical protein